MWAPTHTSPVLLHLYWTSDTAHKAPERCMPSKVMCNFDIRAVPPATACRAHHGMMLARSSSQQAAPCYSCITLLLRHVLRRIALLMLAMRLPQRVHGTLCCLPCPPSSNTIVIWTSIISDDLRQYRVVHPVQQLALCHQLLIQLH